MRIVADSGSTKTHWLLMGEDASCRHFYSVGLNPLFSDADSVSGVLSDVFGGISFDGAAEVFFYGAGVGLNDEADGALRSALVSFFGSERVWLFSDMLGVCRALLGNSAGIAGILGTGSNSCLYDGVRIVRNVPAGGYVLGDEGSGAYLGKCLVGDFIKGVLPADLDGAFRLRFPGVSYNSIVEAVYRGERPSRYLASFAVFLAENAGHDYVRGMLYSAFSSFFDRNVVGYFDGSADRSVWPVALAGSVADAFGDLLAEVAAERGIALARVIKEPMDGLSVFHGFKL